MKPASRPHDAPDPFWLALTMGIVGIVLFAFAVLKIAGKV